MSGCPNEHACIQGAKRVQILWTHIVYIDMHQSFIGA